MKRLPDDDRLIKMLDVLVERTDRGAAQWKTTDDPEAFLLPLKSGGVVIDRYLKTNRYWLRVLDKDGVTLEELSGVAQESARSGWISQLADLWQRVRRQVLRIDEKIDAVLEELEGPPGQVGGRGESG
jgi:hypothetical protein